MSNHIQRFRSRLLGDARHFQILSLSAFLTYGIVDLGWGVQWSAFAVIIGTSLAVQAVGIKVTGRKWHGLKSALITALGLCLLLKANSLGTYALGAGIAIGSKYLFRFDKVHIFNPANIGIVLAILLTGDAWISPGQWGSAPMLIFFFGSAAAMVLLKCGRVDTSLWFLGTFALLEFSRTVLFLGWTPDVVFHRLSNGALLLFTFFMITDPVTTPRHRKGRIAWSVMLALITFVVSQFYYVHTAPVWTLFVISPLTVVLNKVWKGKRFRWFQVEESKPQPLTSTSNSIQTQTASL